MEKVNGENPQPPLTETHRIIKNEKIKTEIKNPSLWVWVLLLSILFIIVAYFKSPSDIPQEATSDLFVSSDNSSFIKFIFNTILTLLKLTISIIKFILNLLFSIVGM